MVWAGTGACSGRTSWAAPRWCAWSRSWTAGRWPATAPASSRATRSPCSTSWGPTTSPPCTARSTAPCGEPCSRSRGHTWSAPRCSPRSTPSCARTSTDGPDDASTSRRWPRRYGSIIHRYTSSCCCCSLGIGSSFVLLSLLLLMLLKPSSDSWALEKEREREKKKQRENSRPESRAAGWRLRKKRGKGSNSVGPTVERLLIYLDYIAFQWPNCHCCLTLVWQQIWLKVEWDTYLNFYSTYRHHFFFLFTCPPTPIQRGNAIGWPTRQNDGAPSENWGIPSIDCWKRVASKRRGIFPIPSSSLYQKGNLWLSRTCTALLDRQKFMSRRKGQTEGKGTPFSSLCIYTFQSAQEALHAPSSPSHVSMQNKHLAGCWIPYLFHSVAWQLIITESYLPLFSFFFSSDGFALSSQADCWHLCWPTLWCPKGRAVHPCTWHLLPANQHPRNQLQQRAPGTVHCLHTWKHQKKKSSWTEPSNSSSVCFSGKEEACGNAAADDSGPEVLWLRSRWHAGCTVERQRGHQGEAQWWPDNWPSYHPHILWVWNRVNHLDDGGEVSVGQSESSWTNQGTYTSLPSPIPHQTISPIIHELKGWSVGCCRKSILT